MVFFILVLIYGYIIFVVEVYIVSTVVFSWEGGRGLGWGSIRREGSRGEV
jgi:hypothetical protein